MSKVIRIGDVEFDAQQYAINGTGVLGIKKSGKSWLAKTVAEQMLIAGIPIIVFDAIGVWRHLKRASGPSGRGFPIVVAGGEEPDLPLTVANAKEIVRVAIRENIPLVIDLFDKNLSKADWRRIVQTCFRTLLFENVGVRHIFLEEAAEYVPQRVTDGETFAEVEKLVRMGGNRSLGITLINPRAQEINKAVLELCENLVCMKQRGSHAIDSLEKWMDRLDPKQAKMIAASLPSLKAGECWLFTGEDDAVHRTRSGALLTFHPDRSKPEAAKASRAAVVNDELVTRLKTDLSKVIEEAQANDPKALRARVAELDKQVRDLKAAPAQAFDQGAEQRGYERGWREGAADQRRKMVPTLAAITNQTATINRIARELDVAVNDAYKINDPKEEALTIPTFVAKSVQKRIAAQKGLPAPFLEGRDKVLRPANGGSIPASQMKVLAVLSTYGECDSGRLALLSGYTYSGGFRNILAALRTAGYIEGENTGTMRITDAGEACGPFEALPRGDELRDHWLNFSQFGSAERDVLRTLIDHPRGFDGHALAAKVGREYSGGFRNTLSKLRTAGVLVGKNTGVMVASPELLA